MKARPEITTKHLWRRVKCFCLGKIYSYHTLLHRSYFDLFLERTSKQICICCLKNVPTCVYIYTNK